MGVYHCTFHQLSFTAQKMSWQQSLRESLDVFISLANMSNWLETSTDVPVLYKSDRSATVKLIKEIYTVV